MTGYEKRTAEKKQAILDVSRELFSARGIQDVSISEIAGKAGVSQVSIYNYFGDKKALAKEAFISYIETAMEHFDQILLSELPFQQKLELILQGKSNMISQIAVSNFDEKALDDESLRHIFQEALIEKASEMYIKFISLGKREGAIDSTLPTEAVLLYLLSSMSVISSASFLASDKEHKMGMIHLFLYGIIGNK